MPKSIAATLALLQGGTFLDQCTEQLAVVVRGVEETGKAGKLTITLDLTKSAGAIAIVAKVTDKVPEPKAEADLLWATVEGSLVTQNPHQRNLDLQVASQNKEVRTG